MFILPTHHRKNKTLTWLATDSQENYKTTNVNGALNYTEDEVQYILNEEGFRCDSFDLESEYPILFLGCSFTEGIGLPINEVWSYKIIQRVKDKLNKEKIPLWSLASAGQNIDFASVATFKYATKIKPKIILYLLSGISRRSYCYENLFVKHWVPNMFPGFTKNPSLGAAEKVLSDDSFSLYQSYRSLTSLSQLDKIYGTKIFVFDLTEMDLVPVEKKKELFANFGSIDYIPIEKITPNNDDFLKQRPIRARDNQHWGEWFQDRIVDIVWDKVSETIN